VGVKRAGPTAKVKNRWSHTTTPPICLHDMDRGSFTSTLLTGSVKEEFSLVLSPPHQKKKKIYIYIYIYIYCQLQKFGHSESVLQNLLLCEIVYVVTNIVSDFLISFH